MRTRSVTRLTAVLSFALAALASAPAVAATAPTVRTGSASAVTPQTATLIGSINPHGLPTAFFFNFGRTKTYGSRTSTGDAGSGTTSRAVSASLTGLRPNTTYHFRLVAFSTAGTTRAGDRNFRTPQIPTTSTISVSQNPVVYSQPVSITGSLTGPSVGGKKVALLSKPFPFIDPFKQIGNTVVTNPVGGYSFVWAPLITMQLRVVDLSKPSVMSPTVIENVALETTLRVRHLHRGRHRIRFRGRVIPARIGNPVLIQRRTRRGWATVAFTLTRARTATFSGFSRRLRLHRSGHYRAVVKTTGGDYADGTSRARRISLNAHHR